jgi:hypothetical protein
VYFDGRLIGRANTHEGFYFQLETAAGLHDIGVQTAGGHKDYTLLLDAGRRYVVDLQFDTGAGTFRDSCELAVAP